MNNSPDGERTVGFQPDGGRGFFVRKISADPIRPSIDAITSRVAVALTPAQHDQPDALLVSTISGLIYDLDDPNETKQASQALVDLGEDAVQPLINCLGLTPRPGLPQYLEEIGDSYTKVIVNIGSPAIPHLLVALRSQEYMARLRVANALGRIQAEPAKVMLPILDILEESETDTPYYTESADFIKELGRTLTQMGSSDPDSYPKLLRLMSHSNHLVRGIAYKSVASHGLDASVAVPVLFDRFKEETEKSNQEMIVYALAKYGKEDPRILSFLLDLLDDSDLASYAADAIRPATFNLEDVVPRVREMLNKSEDEFYPSLILKHFEKKK